MTKRKSTTKRTKQSTFMTVLGMIIVGISVLFGLVTGEFANEEATPTPAAGFTEVASVPGSVNQLTFQRGFGATKGFWQVYFTAPSGSGSASEAVGGIDAPLISAVNAVQNTLDIAAFEWNNPNLTAAVIAAHDRGVQVRMVVDNEHTIADMEDLLDEGEEAPFKDIIDAGIPYRDDARSGLMHNKFMIMDSTTVWTGSMNYTINGAYRNNNNMLSLRSQRAVQAYQAEFDEMFVKGEFASSRSAVNGASFNQDGDAINILFSPEDKPVDALLALINGAQHDIRFMTFSFTLDSIGEAVLARSQAGVEVQGVFETVGSETTFSEMRRLYCAGIDVRQDGNGGILHHKVFVVDGQIVATGSFNISESATTSNDENIIIITDPDLAAQYLAEFARVQAIAAAPDPADMNCS
jgi:phosphatidylserine/phosphatidylglycerophosphate/cardiolipin synthase-like enzyme